MFRVRKVNRPSVLPDARSLETRPRLQEFVFASKRQKRRARTSPPVGAFRELKAYQEACGVEHAPDTLLMRIMEGKTMLLVVPISQASATPSMSEAMRMVTAIGLMRLLEAKGVGPLVVALWPGIPAELDPSPRVLMQRDGNTLASDHMSLDEVLQALPDNDFRKEIEADAKSWASLGANEDVLSKLRILVRYACSDRVVVLPPPPKKEIPAKSSRRSVKLRSSYRQELVSVIERFPAIGLVHASGGETLSVDTGVRSTFEGEIVPFATTLATIVENKVERWLDKYDIAPEVLMAPKARVASLVAERFPKNAVGEIQALREGVLGKIFRLEHQLKDEGFPSDKVLDKLANQVDAQFDRMKASITQREGEERKIGLNQLSKARAYLRPEGRLQYEAMSMLHYLGFYGTSILSDVVDAIQVGDARHHLLYASP